jgi:hypothetical protein
VGERLSQHHQLEAAISRVEDFDGVKMRVMQNTIFIDTFKALGSNAVPMAFSEVYSALETKTVDGQENPFANIENSKYYEVQKYLTLTRHGLQPAGGVLSKKTWDTLSGPGAGGDEGCAVRRPRRGAPRQPRAGRCRASPTSRARACWSTTSAPPRCSASATAPGSVYEQHGKAIGDEAIQPGVRELKRIRGN